MALWLGAFWAQHVLMEHEPVRAALVAQLGGEKAFRAAYSAASLALFVPLVVAHRRGNAALARAGASREPLVAPGSPARALLGAAALLGGAGVGLGYAKPSPVGVEEVERSGLVARAREPVGALRVTRHPIFCGAALVMAARAAVVPWPHQKLLYGGMALATLGSVLHQDLRVAPRLPPAFRDATSVAPGLAIAQGRQRWPALAELNLPAAAAGAAAAVLFVVALA